MGPLFFLGAALAGGALWLFRQRANVVMSRVPSPSLKLDPVLHPFKIAMPEPATHEDLVTAATANLVALARPENMVPIEYQGETWFVSPQYVGPLGIGEAFSLAQTLGLSLPSPGLVDAIWRAADLKIAPPTRASDGTPRTMSSPEVFADQKNRIDALVGGRAFTLLGGSHKDVVMGDATSGPGLKAGKVGIYGWHSEAPIAGLALHAPVTPGPGRVIQQPFGGHGLDWIDYSQALRLVRKG